MNSKRNFMETKKKSQYNRDVTQFKYALMIDDWGPFVEGRSYEIYQSGKDWVKIKSQGRMYCVSKSLIHPNPHAILFDSSNDVEEDYFSEDFIF